MFIDETTDGTETTETQDQTETTETVEQKSETKEEATEQQTTETFDPNVVDDDGVPWKKKAKEFERKYRQTLEKIATTTQEPPQNEDEEIPATRAGVKQVLSELSREEQVAEQVLNETVEELLIENPGFAAYKDELSAMMKTVDMNARKNPDAVKAVAMGLWGKKNWKPAPTQPKPVKKLVSTKQQDVLTPSPKGGAPTEVALTDAEQEYAEHHRFIGVFDNEEIKEMYQKAHSKKKQGG
jgi:hypothetical protein